MKKTFKILSCLAVVVVAFIMSFTLVRVNGASDDYIFRYQDENVDVHQTDVYSLDIDLKDVSNETIEPFQSYFIFKLSDNTEWNFSLSLATNTEDTEYGMIVMWFDEMQEQAQEIIQVLDYKVYNNQGLLYEYPETIPEEGGETMGGFITQVFETLGDIIEGFSSTLVSLFENVVKIFYTAPTGSETVGSLTVVGVLTLVAMGCGLVIWGFKFLRSLIRVKTK